MGDHSDQLTDEREPLNNFEVSRLIDYPRIVVREFKITLKPIASVIINFSPDGIYNHDRGLDIMGTSILLDEAILLESVVCIRGSYEYRGRAITEIRPIGAKKGTYIQRVNVEGVEIGDRFGCRLLNDDIPGASITVDIFDNR